MKKLLVLASFLYFSVSAQEKTPEPLNLSQKRSYSKEIGAKYNHSRFYNHPDFGSLPESAPKGKNLVEDLSQRKVDQRQFIDLDNPQIFYLQKSAVPINYLKDGNLVAINAKLNQIDPKLYQAKNQPFPTELNLAEKRSVIYVGSKFLKFNHFKLKVVSNNNKTEVLKANWDKISVADGKCYITDIFPGIDMEMKYLEASVKSDFIIKKNLNVKHLYFIDELNVSPSYAIKLEESILKDKNKGRLIVYDKSTEETALEINPARIHDSSNSKQSWINPYGLSQNELTIICDSTILNDKNTVYPVIVDPLVTVGPIKAGATYLSGSALAPSSCIHSITLTVPAGTTPTDVSANWSIHSNWCFGYYTGHGALGDDCWQSEAQIWLSSSCGSGRSPAGTTFWNCNGCNSTGNWNASIPSNSSGMSSLIQCFVPSATDQTISFNINFSRTACSPYSNYDGCSPVSRSYCQTLDNWSVTLTGRNLETLNETTTGNGTLNVTVPCGSNYTMDPLIKYGVAPFTYSWNTGGSSATKTITPTTTGTQTHILTVKDAANITRTATFNVTTTCTLPITLISFEGKLTGNHAQLTWTAADEKKNDYYIVEKSENGINFKEINKVMATVGNSTPSSYSVNDNDLQGNKIKYYRLKILNSDGDIGYSSIIKINTGIQTNEMVLTPNPVKNMVQILLPETYSSDDISVFVYTINGIERLTKKFQKNEALILDLKELTSGSYVVRAFDKNNKPISSKTFIKD
ncbi:T9SS type A sorting domain-containing protein [Pedobacter nanyangensis]|uniref:T9SS type A sorting domain-containing protein n=1 Tax=Pedobacter nanyangensis TaxID=1562389 RepID=UPI000DE44A2B|nr:T9SS type A sorting domain-containing protein [Pedobacter nanyangensis]